MLEKKNKISALFASILAVFLLITASGCNHNDIEYKYDKPKDQGDCPTDSLYRSGGTSVRERHGGTSIRDRNGSEVTSFCEAQTCPGGATPNPTTDPWIVWHTDDHDTLVATRTCPAT